MKKTFDHRDLSFNVLINKQCSITSSIRNNELTLAVTTNNPPTQYILPIKCT